MAETHELAINKINEVWRVVKKGTENYDIRVAQGDRINWQLDGQVGDTDLLFQFTSDYRDYFVPVADDDEKIAESQVPLSSSDSLEFNVRDGILDKGETVEVPYAVVVVDAVKFVEGGSAPIIIIKDQ